MGLSTYRSNGFGSRPRSLRWSLLLASASCGLLGLLFTGIPSIAQTYDAAPRHSDTGAGSEPTKVVIYRTMVVPSTCEFPPTYSSEGAEEERAASLDKDGPRVPPVFSMSAFSVMGYSKGNWPVVIDYLLEQDSLLLVVIAPEGSEPLLYHLNGKRGHWQSRLNIPASLGDQPVVSQYVIRSLDENLGQVTRSHVHIHGIAAGPRAVGSIGIDQVNFAPGTIRTALREKAHYSFHSISDFKSSEVSFIRLALSNGEIIAARVGGKSMGSIVKDGQKAGDWDGKSNGGGNAANRLSAQMLQWLRDPHGQHVLLVRAWWGAKDGGDWVTALSDEMVSVE